MQSRIHLIFTIGSMLLFINLAMAQSKPRSNESMIWIEAIEKVKFNNRFSSTLLWHHRIFLDREQTYQNIYWASLDAKLTKNFSISGGLIYFRYHKYSHDKYLAVPEVRPFQSITYSTALGKVKTSFRFMVEERYMSQTRNGEVMNDHDFNFRFRNRLKAIIPMNSSMKLELSNEYIINGSSMDVDRFNQNRASARIHYYIKPLNLDINAGYLHWLVNTTKEMQHRHSLMIGVKHQINFTK